MSLVICPRCEEKRELHIVRGCALCKEEHEIQEKKAVMYILLRGEMRTQLERIQLADFISQGLSIEECRQRIAEIRQYDANN